MITIEPVTANDLPALVALLEEMDNYYGDTTVGTAAERIAQVSAVLFGNPPQAIVLLAKKGDKVVGMASYSFLWPATSISTSLYLKELYVRQGHRRAGVGKRLMARLIEVARSGGCTRVEWTTDHGNDEALRFYEMQGYSVNAEKVFYRVEVLG